MKIKNYYFKLKEVYNDKDSLLVLSYLLNCKILDIKKYFDLDYDLDKDIELILQQGRKNIPINYILKSRDFFEYNFYIDERVLIPRFETEELVDYVLKILKFNKKDNLKVLDMCCGSGVIGITLAKKLGSIDLTLSDISEEALDVARINCTRLNVSSKIILSDLFSNIEEKYDVIVCNPPYLIEGEEELNTSLEPSIALFGGIEIYDRIFQKILNYVNDKYLIALETGTGQHEEILKLISKYKIKGHVYSVKDMNQRDRFILIYLW